MDLGEPLPIRPLGHNYNINEVLDAIQRVEKPTVHIVEQPASRALRFRYICEGRSAGSIPGASSSPERRSFPSIEVRGYRGLAQVVVSCVTADEPYRPHPHKLVGRDKTCSQGVCKLRVDFSHSPRVSFTNLGVQCVKKKEVEAALQLRKDLKVDPFNTGFEHMHDPASIDLNVVRLCFQVLLTDESGRRTMLDPVVTQRIYDKKALSELYIARISQCSGSVYGGDNIILLCEKVSRDDVEVYFFEAGAGDDVTGAGDVTGAVGGGWQAAAEVELVHKQVALVLKVPRYHRPHTTQNVRVYIQLRRKSDNERSNAVPFEYIAHATGTRPTDFSLLSKLLRADSCNSRSDSRVDSTDLTVTSSTDASQVVSVDDDSDSPDTKDNNYLGQILDEVVQLDEIYYDKPILTDLVSSDNILDQALKNPIKLSEVQVCNEDVEFICVTDKLNDNEVQVIDNNRLKIDGKRVDKSNVNDELSNNNRTTELLQRRASKRNRNMTNSYPALKKRSLLSSLQKSTKSSYRDIKTRYSNEPTRFSTAAPNVTVDKYSFKSNSRLDKAVTIVNVEQGASVPLEAEDYTSLYDIDSSEAILVTESVFSVGEDAHYALYRLVPRDGGAEETNEIYATVDPAEIFQ